MHEILFVISAVCCLNWLVFALVVIFGHDINLPAPILHIWGHGYKNTYLSSFAIGYQVWYWMFFI